MEYNVQLNYVIILSLKGYEILRYCLLSILLDVVNFCNRISIKMDDEIV